MNHLLQNVQNDQLLKVMVALLMGAFLGLEREYKRKAAGMRTMTLICISSTVFTILSTELGFPNSPDRVASNILTGVGFIGAGVIFKGDYTIDGITTAASIWIAAAIGMAIGLNQYWMAGATLLASLFVLILLEYVEIKIATVNYKRNYYIFFYEDNFSHVEIEKTMHSFQLKYKNKLIMRKENLIEVNYAVRGHRNKIEQLDDFLLRNKNIFQYQVQSAVTL